MFVMMMFSVDVHFLGGAEAFLGGECVPRCKRNSFYGASM